MTTRHPNCRAANVMGGIVTGAVYLVAVLQAGKATISHPSPEALAVDCALAAIPLAAVMASALRAGR